MKYIMYICRIKLIIHKPKQTKMKTTLTIDVTYKGQTLSVDFETGQDFEEFIIDFVNSEEGFNPDGDENFEEITELSEITYIVTNWDDAEDYQSLQDIELLNEIADASISYDWDVISSAIECGIQPSDIDEAYAGSFRSDEDFAQDMAEQLGEYDFRNESWPKTCIDWEQAARELMYDYSEANGHYFRNF